MVAMLCEIKEWAGINSRRPLYLPTCSVPDQQFFVSVKRLNVYECVNEVFISLLYD